ncbi:hypothetical protein L798_01499 [Zootermopsis nevadensis]|uniref:Uncharacterized protein n=1 Tax=Zootermopsis nevadensis TaxID=136037 RepID=A0A067QW47_ZOONE|nr:hypothetical protein L798_01499 [Zootermopsis nevadensis]
MVCLEYSGSSWLAGEERNYKFPGASKTAMNLLYPKKSRLKLSEDLSLCTTCEYADSSQALNFKAHPLERVSVVSISKITLGPTLHSKTILDFMIDNGYSTRTNTPTKHRGQFIQLFIQLL